MNLSLDTQCSSCEVLASIRPRRNSAHSWNKRRLPHSGHTGVHGVHEVHEQHHLPACPTTQPVPPLPPPGLSAVLFSPTCNPPSFSLPSFLLSSSLSFPPPCRPSSSFLSSPSFYLSPSPSLPPSLPSFLLPYFLSLKWKPYAPIPGDWGDVCLEVNDDTERNNKIHIIEEIKTSSGISTHKPSTLSTYTSKRIAQ